MPSQGELLKESIARLEPKYGADNPFVKGLRMQLIGFERQERRQNEMDQFHLAVSPELKPKLAPEGPETEAESIRAEALRRLKVDRFVERTPAPTSNLSESQSNTQQTTGSVGVCGP